MGTNWDKNAEPSLTFGGKYWRDSAIENQLTIKCTRFIDTFWPIDLFIKGLKINYHLPKNSL